jgi:hypothetical protein
MAKKNGIIVKDVVIKTMTKDGIDRRNCKWI